MANRANTIGPVLFPSQSYATGTWYGSAAGQPKPTTVQAAQKQIRNDAWIGAYFVVDVTAVGGAGTITFKLQGYDPVSAKWFDVPGATTTALAAVSTISLLIFPGTIETANVRVSQILPPLYGAVAIVAGNAVTFSANGWMLGY